MSVEYDLKQKLDSIIDFAYRNATKEDEPRLEKYKYFKIKYTDKSYSSFLARYHHKDSFIEMTSGSYRGENINQYVTLIHELSHHIQAVKYGKWCSEWKAWVYSESVIKTHGKEFYEIFERLLHAALDMKILNLDDVRNMPHVSSGHNKIQKMLDRYVPCTEDECTNNICNNIRIYCYNSFNCKDALKQDGYKYNSIVRAWYKELPATNQNKEKQKLLSYGLKEEDIIIKDSNLLVDMKAEVAKKISSKCYIVQFDFNKSFVLRDDYGELKKLKEKCPYIKIRQFDNYQERWDETIKLQKENISLYDDDELDKYVKEYVKKKKRK